MKEKKKKKESSKGGGGGGVSKSKRIVSDSQNGDDFTPNSSMLDMIAALRKTHKKRVKSLKIQAKQVHTEIKTEEEALEREKKLFLQYNSKESQQKAIQGKELIKWKELLRMGFEEDVIQAHLQAENKKLQKLALERQKERRTVEENIQKMKDMNEQSERAVNAAEMAVKNAITKAQKLKSDLDEAEVKLYSLESKVKYTRNARGVDITNKESLRDGIKEIVQEIKTRCEDREIVKMVMKVAGKCLAADMEMAAKAAVAMNRNRVDDSASDDEDDDSVEISDASSDEDM